MEARTSLRYDRRRPDFFVSPTIYEAKEQPTMQYYPWMRRLSVVLAATLTMWTQSAQAIDRPLAKGGQASAVIVLGKKSPAFYRWVAGELQSYVKKLSTADLPIVSDDQLPAEKFLILLGGPQFNPLVAETVRQRQADFAALKPEGFVLKTIAFHGRPALVVGGNDETGTMYAAYELLERLGIVFQLTNDVIPQQKPDLAMPALDVAHGAGAQASRDALLPRDSLVHGS